KVKLFSDVPSFTDFYFTENVAFSPDALAEFTPETKSRLAKLRDAYAKLSTFDAAILEPCLKNVAGELGIKSGLLVHPVRMACTGQPIGPRLFQPLQSLGQARVLRRIDPVLPKNGAFP